VTPEVVRRVADGFATGTCLIVAGWVLLMLFNKKNTAKLLDRPEWGNFGAFVVVFSLLLATLFAYGMM
jgi:hypothetical protein